MSGNAPPLACPGPRTPASSSLASLRYPTARDGALPSLALQNSALVQSQAYQVANQMSAIQAQRRAEYRQAVHSSRLARAEAIRVRRAERIAARLNSVDRSEPRYALTSITSER